MTQKPHQEPKISAYPEEKSPNENYVSIIDNDVILNFLNEYESSNNNNKG